MSDELCRLLKEVEEDKEEEEIVSLVDSCVECVCSRLAILSMLTVRLVVLESSQLYTYKTICTYFLFSKNPGETRIFKSSVPTVGMLSLTCLVAPLPSLTLHSTPPEGLCLRFV